MVAQVDIPMAMKRRFEQSLRHERDLMRAITDLTCSVALLTVAIEKLTQSLPDTRVVKAVGNLTTKEGEQDACKEIYDLD